VIGVAVRWYLRYGLSYRDVEELLSERGIEVDHVTIYRWVQAFTTEFIDAAGFSRHATGDRWFLDETYVKVAGRWNYLYRAVDQRGQVLDVLVSTAEMPLQQEGSSPARCERQDGTDQIFAIKTWRYLRASMIGFVLAIFIGVGSTGSALAGTMTSKPPATPASPHPATSTGQTCACAISARMPGSRSTRGCCPG